MSSGQAPIFRDAFLLCQWVLERLQSDPRPLARALCGHGIQLLETVALALKNRHREERVDQADELLIRIRLELRMAARIGMLKESQSEYALSEADRIGRQLGGWQRALAGP